MKFFLAPLAGFTDAPFRKVAYLHGADLTYTEMLSAAALAHNHKSTLELLKTIDGEGPLAAQVFGATASDLACATKCIHEYAANYLCELNLNAGCPMTKVTRSGAGAKLIGDPKKVYDLLCAMKENTSLPITLKTRLGSSPDKVAIFELLDAAQSAGAVRIIIHARFTSQMHGGETNLELLSQVVEKSKIPVTGNGSIINLDTAEKMKATNVDSIMIGRAALGNPGIFNELKGIGRCDRKIFFKEHLKALNEFSKDESYVRLKFRTHLFRYFAGIPGAASLRAKINQAKTIQELEGICSLLH